jgi:hypothetical protein
MHTITEHRIPIKTPQIADTHAITSVCLFCNPHDSAPDEEMGMAVNAMLVAAR